MFTKTQVLFIFWLISHLSSIYTIETGVISLYYNAGPGSTPSIGKGFSVYPYTRQYVEFVKNDYIKKNMLKPETIMAWSSQYTDAKDVNETINYKDTQW